MNEGSYCGLDFGTSNSTLGIVRSDRPILVPLEGAEVTIPSALFFDFEEHSQHFGRDAIATYMEGGEGRMMRALKSILGSPTIHEATMIGTERKPFTAVLGLFLLHLKNQAESFSAQEISHVVMGRPVHFVDHDSSADREAEDTLRDIARKTGFCHVEFEFEPVAAARDFQQQVQSEEIALIIDIGGGTSDFTLLKVAPSGTTISNRNSRDDILANAGVHIGGTDFDRWLSLARVMPLLGYQSPMKKVGRLMPVGFYHDLATWQKINFLYDHKTSADLRCLRREAERPDLLDRLLHLLEMREGHRLALGVEQAKVKLSEQIQTWLDLSYAADGLKAEITQAHLMECLEEGTERIKATISEATAQAGLRDTDISVVFLTGGSTKIPYVRECLTAMAPRARIIDGDAFGSVGTGLVLEARHRFG